MSSRQHTSDSREQFGRSGIDVTRSAASRDEFPRRKVNDTHSDGEWSTIHPTS